MNRIEVAERLRALAYDVEQGKADGMAIMQTAFGVQDQPFAVLCWQYPEDREEVHRTTLGTVKHRESLFYLMEDEAARKVFPVLLSANHA